MNREIINFDTEQEWLALRDKDITSTDASALLNVSPYKTYYELWHEKSHKYKKEWESNSFAKWGQRLEAVIAEGIAEEQNLVIKPMKHYIRIPDLRLGSSFDFEIVKNDERPDLKGILEIKNVDHYAFNNNWIVESKQIVEAPPYIEMQIQHQLLASGYDYVRLCAFVGGNTFYTVDRFKDQDIQDLIVSKSVMFWQSVLLDIMPSPDFIKDAEFIKAINSYADPNLELQASESVFEAGIEYHKINKEVKKLEEKIEGLKAFILTEVGEASKVTSNMFTLSLGVVGPAQVSYTRKPYRMFKLTPKKELKEMHE